ncbi:MAG TPA: MBL fold metallo-hydrolase [Chlamydiales bacterium]|nr:MBL fold metallo-hydrolase [Chlamydiales bacterium]
MFGFCPLASGSKGNCLYVGSRKTCVLIDAGISAALAVERMRELGVNPHSIQAILITHEHLDHIKGLMVLAEQLKVPVLANSETAKGIVAALGERPKFKIFTTGETFEFGDLVVHPFSIPHDTLDPVAFTIQIESVKLGICADIGHITSLVRKHLEGCDYLYIEANHEPAMVHASSRPKSLKQRILCKQGHLSNGDCAELLTSIYHPGLKHVHLAHLSGECNAEEVALRIVREALMGKMVEVSIAYQDKISKPIYFKKDGQECEGR